MNDTICRTAPLIYYMFMSLMMLSWWRRFAVKSALGGGISVHPAFAALKADHGNCMVRRQIARRIVVVGGTWFAVRAGTYPDLPSATKAARAMSATTSDLVIVRPAQSL
jgi:hypothetical protein